jgi:hypothetical protein
MRDRPRVTAGEWLSSTTSSMEDRSLNKAIASATTWELRLNAQRWDINERD